MSKRAFETTGFSIGDSVLIHGLVGAADHNGKVGKIVKCPAEHKGRYVVEIQPGMEKALKLENLSVCTAEPTFKKSVAGNLVPSEPEKPILGDSVRIHSLVGAADLNGTVGKIVKCPDEPQGRYVIEIRPGVEKALKVGNLSICTAEPAFKKSVAGNLAPSEPEKPITREEKIRAAREEREKLKEEKKRSLSQGMDARSNEFKIGQRVRVGGLNGSKELNGQVAVVFGFDRSTARYVVEFENGQGQRKVHGSSLTNMGVATGALAAKARMFASHC